MDSAPAHNLVETGRCYPLVFGDEKRANIPNSFSLLTNLDPNLWLVISLDYLRSPKRVQNCPAGIGATKWMPLVATSSFNCRSAY